MYQGLQSAVLPNTGSRPMLAIISVVTMAIGVAVIASTVVRLAAKKAYKA